MKITDIRNSIIGLIKGVYASKKVYDEKVRGGFEQGSFVVTLKPITNNMEMVNYRDKTIMVSIQYKGSSENYEEMYSIYDELMDKAFSNSFEIVSTDNLDYEQKRHLLPQNCRSEFIEDRFNIIFDLVFIDIIQVEAEELAQELEVEFNIEQ